MFHPWKIHSRGWIFLNRFDSISVSCRAISSGLCSSREENVETILTDIAGEDEVDKDDNDGDNIDGDDDDIDDNDDVNDAGGKEVNDVDDEEGEIEGEEELEDEAESEETLDWRSEATRVGRGLESCKLINRLARFP